MVIFPISSFLDAFCGIWYCIQQIKCQFILKFSNKLEKFKMAARPPDREWPWPAHGNTQNKFWVYPFSWWNIKPHNVGVLLRQQMYLKLVNSNVTVECIWPNHETCHVMGAHILHQPPYILYIWSKILYIFAKICLFSQYLVFLLNFCYWCRIQ